MLILIGLLASVSADRQQRQTKTIIILIFWTALLL